MSDLFLTGCSGGTYPAIGLSLLPPELLMNILQFLSSPRDLYTIVEASSQFYRVFAAYKQSILSAILLNAIPSEVEADFILAYRAQRIRKFVPEHSKRHRFLTRRCIRHEETFNSLDRESIAILNQFKSRNDIERLHEVILDRAFLLDAWKFYCNFEHFIVSYSNSALLNLQKSFYSSGESLSLSVTERIRLHRAFYRWEIYTCLFQISLIFCGDIRSGAPSTDPAPRFTSMLRPWEVEEISCVGQFYITLMKELSDRIEDDFVIMIKEKMNALVINEEMRNELEGVGDTLDWCTLHWFDNFWKRSYRSRHNEYLVSHGILCIRKLTSAPFPIARRMIVRSDLEAKNKISLLLGLQESNPRTEREENHEGLKGRSTKNDSDECLERSNFGWRWAVENVARVVFYAPVNHDLRNQGYVFWDKARLLKFEEFQSSRGPVNDLFELPSSYQEHATQPSVEFKLRGFPVHWSVVEEIANEIDGGHDDNVDFSRDWKI